MKDENHQKLDQIIDLLLTPQGRRDGLPLNQSCRDEADEIEAKLTDAKLAPAG